MGQSVAATLLPAQGGRPQGGARRILMVVHGYPPQQTMGAELQARRKARWWRARGHEVTILAADPQTSTVIPFGTVEEDFDRVDGLEVCRVRFAVPDATQSLRDTYEHPLLAAVVERAIARVRPDLIYQVSGYLFGTVPLQIAARLGIPTVLFAMDYWSICQRITLLRPDGACCPGPTGPADCAACRIADRGVARRFGTDANRVGRQALVTLGRHLRVSGVAERLGVKEFAAREEALAAALRGVALVVVNSHFLAEQLAHAGVPRERFLVIRQGIDLDEFADDASGPANDPTGPLRIRYLGQISHHKGTDLLVDAAARLCAEGLALTLALHGPVSGPPTYLADLQQRIAPHAARITLSPSLDRAALVAALHETDLLVVPSRWYENSPNVILEAFAAGVPVVAADHGGMAEMVRDGVDGLLFHPGDVDALTATLRRVAIEPLLLAQLRAGVRRPHGIDVEMLAEEAAIAQIGSGAKV
jgi:glycosyltransferase involved in cell wall biosynthesis